MSDKAAETDGDGAEEQAIDVIRRLPEQLDIVDPIGDQPSFGGIVVVWIDSDGPSFAACSTIPPTATRTCG
jgi:hypothetical protein